MKDGNLINIKLLKAAKPSRAARSLERVEEVAWDLMNAALAMSISMSNGDEEDGRQRIIEWLNGDGFLEEHLSGKWDDLSIFNGGLEIRAERNNNA